MLKLRTILLYNYPYYIFLLMVVIISIVRLIIPKESYYSKSSKEFIGKITSYNYSNNYLELTLKKKNQYLFITTIKIISPKYI